MTRLLLRLRRLLSVITPELPMPEMSPAQKRLHDSLAERARDGQLIIDRDGRISLNPYHPETQRRFREIMNECRGLK